MSVTTIRPTSTLANGTSTIGGGAASRHAALSDDDDAKYVDITGGFYDAVSLGFTTPSPGGTIFAAIPRMEASAQGSTWVLAGVLMSAGGDLSASSFLVAGQQEYQANGAFGDGDPLSVAIWNGGSNTVRLHELFLDVYYVAVPVVDVTGPTGTLTETNRPTITWRTTFDEHSQGVGPSDLQVRVFTDAVYGGGGFNAATSTAAWETDRAASPSAIGGGVRVSANLANDTYRAYVRAKDSVSGWGSWDYAEFTVNVTPPDSPALVLTDDDANGRVTATVTPDNSPVATDGVILERSRDGGATWEVVIESEGGSPQTLHDYFAQSGVEVDYRACGWNDTDEDRLYSAYDTDSITPDHGWWLKSATDPSLNVKLDERPRRIRELDQMGRAARQTEQQPLGRDDVVVTQDTRAPRKGTLVFFVADFLEITDAIDPLLDALGPVLIDGPIGDKWRNRWVVFGDSSERRVIEKVWTSMWEVSLPYTEVTAPEVN